MSGAARPAGPAAVTGPAVYQGSRPLPASPGPSVALLRRFPPRPVPGGWAATSPPKPQVIARLGAPPFPTGRANLDQERRRGLTRMLDWLEAQPGESWQDRWITSGADAAGNPAWRGLLAGWLAATGRGPRDPEHVSLLAGRAVMLLVGADVIRPSLGWLLAPATPAGLSAEMARVRDPAGFAALAAIGQENCVNSHTTQLALRRIAAILAAKGGQVADITIGDCLELLQIAGNLLRSSDATSPYFYQLLRAAGVFGAAAPPGRALKTQGQLSCEQLIDRYGIECRPVRDLLVDYLRERQPAVDYPTMHKLSYVLGRLFWRDLELHHPGIASLHLPAEVAAGWKQRITTKTTRPRSAGGDVTEANTSRVNAFDHLVTVRAFYLDLAQWAADDPARWGPWAAPCPVRDTDIAQRGKERSRRKSRMDQRTRERIPVLPALLATVDAGRQAAAQRLRATEAAAPGQSFTVAGQTLRRPARAHASAGRIWAQDPGGGKHRDLTREEHKAFWTWAAVQVLRHTGIRIEELTELSHHSFIQYKLPASGELIPLLQIAPSKTDTERLLVISPELADVLSQIITRIRGGGEAVPLVAAYDYHERVWNPPMPLLFQRHYGGEHYAIGGPAIRELIADALASTGITDASGKPLRFVPHDFRRIFITDTIMHGMPPHIAQLVAGHRDIGVTLGYKAVYPEEVINAHRAFITRRRALRPAGEYRTPTEEEWAEFLGHFERRKLSLGTCGRSYNTPCIHEHACIRCPLQAKLRAGALLPWTTAPFGYRLDPERPRRADAVRVDPGEAALVAQLFDWYLEPQATIYRLARRLTDLGVPTPMGGPRWNTASVRGILRNPSYAGRALSNRTQVAPARGRKSAMLPAGPGVSHAPRPEQDWIAVPVPPIVSEEAFAQVQAKLDANQQGAARNTRHEYLLRALISCGACRLGCTGRQTAAGYRYYLCRGRTDPLRVAQGERCTARYIPAGQLDELVWTDLCALLTDPAHVTRALARVQGGAWLPQELQARQATIRQALGQLERQRQRLLDAYLAEVIALAELDRKRQDLDRRRATLLAQQRQLDAAARQKLELGAVADGIEAFCQTVRAGLPTATFAQRRLLAQLLIDRVVVTHGDVEIRYVLPTSPEGPHRPFCQLRKDHLDGPPAGVAGDELLGGGCHVSGDQGQAALAGLGHDDHADRAGAEHPRPQAAALADGHAGGLAVPGHGGGAGRAGGGQIGRGADPGALGARPAALASAGWRVIQLRMHVIQAGVARHRPGQRDPGRKAAQSGANVGGVRHHVHAAPVAGGRGGDQLDQLTGQLRLGRAAPAPQPGSHRQRQRPAHERQIHDDRRDHERIAARQFLAVRRHLERPVIPPVRGMNFAAGAAEHRVIHRQHHRGPRRHQPASHQPQHHQPHRIGAPPRTRERPVRPAVMPHPRQPRPGQHPAHGAARWTGDQPRGQQHKRRERPGPKTRPEFLQQPSSDLGNLSTRSIGGTPSPESYGNRRCFHIPAKITRLRPTALGCHRRRVPGRVVFEHVVAALAHGSGYERIPSLGCSDRTIRRRLAEWAELGLAEPLHAAALRAYDQIIGLDLGDVAVDGCLTKAPCGGERAGPSPVDRRKGGLKRSLASDGYGIPLGITSAGANRHDAPLLAPTLQAASHQLDHILPGDRTCHLDRGYDSQPTRQLLDQLGFDSEIAGKGVPAPIQAGSRWVVERTHSWMNGYGKLRRCTERNAKIVDFYPYLAAALVTIRQLIQRACTRYRWDTRPTTKRLT